jgi:hypothetical protein
MIVNAIGTINAFAMRVTEMRLILM